MRSTFLLQIGRLCAAAILLLRFTTAAELPEGTGKDIVQVTCSQCHSLERVQAQHLTQEGWENILREMIESGASIDPADMKTIVAYLAKNFGPELQKVRINSASAEEIQRVLHLTEAEAASIVKYRDDHGKFKDFNDLKQVPELEAKLEQQKQLIDFEAAPTPANP